MRVVETIAELRAVLAGHSPVVVVPTMGNLHAGHAELARRGRARGGILAASIFVNRLQFAAGEDFERYPRTFPGDCALLEAQGVDVVFAPPESELYPEPQTFHVSPPALADDLCGKFRQGHFRGMATVVMKLFGVFQPDIAMFGKKDYQQLMLIRQMVRQFALPIEIVGVDTVRAGDGLALSSRNGYLDPKERQEAARLSRVLARVSAGVRSSGDLTTLCNEARNELDTHGWRTEYIEVRRRSDLAPIQQGDRELVVLGASWLGSARLIDNLEFDR